MDVKNIIDLLSGQTKDISYSQLLFESPLEKYIAVSALISYGLFVISSFFSCEKLTLFLIFSSLILLIAHGIIALLNIKGFLKNPIKVYAHQLKENLGIEAELIVELSKYDSGILSEAKKIFEHESKRVNGRITSLMGSIEKIGLFPSILAFAYTVYEFNSKTELTVLSSMLVGLTIGLYLGVFFLKRIVNWQQECVYLINKAQNHMDEVSRIKETDLF